MITKHNRASQFYDEIERMVRGGSAVLDSVVEYCRKHQLEVESVVPLVNRNANLVAALREEAETSNSVERESHLPV